MEQLNKPLSRFPPRADQRQSWCVWRISIPLSRGDAENSIQSRLAYSLELAYRRSAAQTRATAIAIAIAIMIMNNALPLNLWQGLKLLPICGNHAIATESVIVIANAVRNVVADECYS